jgi:tRNA (guanosine-2'-O-)-methyltransferase
MPGFAQSLNVSVAAAITLFAATQSRKPDLTDEERLELRARYMLRSVPRADELVAAAQLRRSHS